MLEAKKEPDKLKRVLTLPIMVFYGLGTMVGAGIYVLIGKVGGEAGLYLPLAFLIAGFIALFTALSYAELSSRFPLSAGAALYIEKAWGLSWLSRVTGWMLVLTGVVSAATMAHGFAGYLQVFFSVPQFVAIIVFVLIIGVMASWGIQESAVLIVLITLVELLGVVFVIAVGATGESIVSLSDLPPLSGDSALGVLVAGFLAFYAFIGFEDMVNVVEEVKAPERTMPLAIIISISVCTGLYIILAIAAIRTLPLSTLTQSDAPLADLVSAKGFSPTWIGIVSLIAVLNGALVQVIMASRVLYGMATQALAPQVLKNINPRTQTPIIATSWVVVLILVFALLLPLIQLAKLTSFIILIIFAAVNISLIRIKRLNTDDYVGAVYPVWVPTVGAVLCLLLLGAQAI
jgi:basic amino acid/polyamine antiporter, APA family